MALKLVKTRCYHVDGWKQGTQSIGEWLYARGYPTGFQVLCHNCNMAEGIYGLCPHNN